MSKLERELTNSELYLHSQNFEKTKAMKTWNSFKKCFDISKDFFYIKVKKIKKIEVAFYLKFENEGQQNFQESEKD